MTGVIADRVDAGGAVRFGIRTASGDEFSADFASASPVERAVLVADVSGSGEFIALAGDGRAVRLWAVSDCALVPVQNAQGQQYTFDLGFTGYGTGVGCADVDGDGTRDLVGLRASGDGTGIERTAVVLHGPRATNSSTTSAVSDAGPEAVQRARQVTCGDLTLASNGVSIGG